MSVHECTCGHCYLTEKAQDHCERTHNVAELEQLRAERDEYAAWKRSAIELQAASDATRLALVAELSEARAQLKAWTHVKVNVPERGESPKWSAEVLGVTNGGRIIVCAYCFMDKSWRDDDDLERDIKFWMPLPALPKVEC